MAPSASSTYDVFLSFRGEDTRKNFTDHLYTALVDAKFHTFRDDHELPRGENINEELAKAIQKSRGSVIVFSKDYTSSRWCLDELVMINELKKTSDHVLVPVFYDIGPSQLRKQAETLAEHPEYKGKQSLANLNSWQAAIRQVTNLAGMVLENESDGHEAKFIKKIVGDLKKKLPLVNHVPLSQVQKNLEDKLKYVAPFINEAEGKQLEFQDTVRPWLRKLKEAVYGAEDLVLEIKTEILRQEMEPESGRSTSEVQEVISAPPSHAAFDLASMYSRVDEVLGRLDSIMGQRKEVLSLEAGAGKMSSQTEQRSTSLVKHSGVCGRDGEKEKLVKLLLSDDESGNENISVIPIVGMGGIGKTTLAQLLYHDVRVKTHFNLRAWVWVSETFDVVKISQQIVESLTSNACNIENLATLQEKLYEAFSGKMIFLVLDDMWSKNYDHWDQLSLPFQCAAHGSKIIVTTRDEDVALMVSTRTVQVHHIMLLSEEDGWLLFEKLAFKIVGVEAPSYLEPIGRQIVRKCRGLPLAIKALGGLLHSKSTEREWQNILDSEIWELPPDRCTIMPSLWLSFCGLPLHLKHCFSYCSIFPKNHQLQKSELVLLWMAQDFFQPKGKEMVEEDAEDCFNDLISRSLLQRSPSSEHFSMHDLFWDLANFVSGEFSLRWDGSASPKISKKTRHFSYMEKNGDSFAELEPICAASYLRTLLPIPEYASYLGTFNRSGFQKVVMEVLPKLKCLRVLKLSMYKIEKLPDSIHNLKLLRHLDMSETAITKLPDSICTLYNLQSLLLCNCRSLKALPTNFGRLISLRHLDIRKSRVQQMPPQMGNLKNLQILKEFMLDKDTAGKNLLELRKLQNLRGSLCISGLMHSRGLEAYIVKDKKFLKELVLTWQERNPDGKDRGASEKEREVLEKLQPHKNLERLSIEGYGGKMLPSWSEYYFSSALVHLKLDRCWNCKSLPALGQLPSLRKLEINELNEVVSIGSEFYYGERSATTCVNKPFRRLESLSFHNMNGWREWCFVGDDDIVAFPKLTCLSMIRCPKLSSMPEKMQSHLPSLLSLKLYHMSGWNGFRAVSNFSEALCECL